MPVHTSNHPRLTPCAICDGGGWVCEDHVDQRWEHDNCGGAGAPCVCNPRAIAVFDEVLASVDERPQR